MVSVMVSVSIGVCIKSSQTLHCCMYYGEFWLGLGSLFARTSLRYVRVFAVADPSVCRLSVCNVDAPYSGVEGFGNISSPL